jgi:hypothetical protein
MPLHDVKISDVLEEIHHSYEPFNSKKKTGKSKIIIGDVE